MERINDSIRAASDKVVHDYHDFAYLTEEKAALMRFGQREEHNSSRSDSENFPVKLHYMLSELEEDGLSQIVSWQPHGRCFLVHNHPRFVTEILPL